MAAGGLEPADRAAWPAVAWLIGEQVLGDEPLDV